MPGPDFDCSVVHARPGGRKKLPVRAHDNAPIVRNDPDQPVLTQVMGKTEQIH
jgi:hypothetical protein